LEKQESQPSKKKKNQKPSVAGKLNFKGDHAGPGVTKFVRKGDPWDVEKRKTIGRKKQNDGNLPEKNTRRDNRGKRNAGEGGEEGLQESPQMKRQERDFSRTMGGNTKKKEVKKNLTKCFTGLPAFGGRLGQRKIRLNP